MQVRHHDVPDLYLRTFSVTGTLNLNLIPMAYVLHYSIPSLVLSENIIVSKQTQQNCYLT